MLAVGRARRDLQQHRRPAGGRPAHREAGDEQDAEFFPGVQKTWGLTFQINEEPLPTGRHAGGLMWAGIANSYFWIDMDNQVAGTYISQQLPFADARSHQLYTDIETATYSYLSSQ